MKEPEFDLLNRFLAPPPGDIENGKKSPVRSPACSRVGSMIIRSRSPALAMQTFEQVSSMDTNKRFTKTQSIIMQASPVRMSRLIRDDENDFGESVNLP